MNTSSEHRFPIAELEAILAAAFRRAGYSDKHVLVVRSKEPELADFQCNGSFATAKDTGEEPMEVAGKIVEELKRETIFRSVSTAEPGFVNMFLSDSYLIARITDLFIDRNFDVYATEVPQNIILDYGGANVAKPLHVGHLRPAIIGDALKRIGRFMGHTVTGDVHLGDWGLQMGMVITELKHRLPELPYFDPDFTGEYPLESPVSIDDLEELYPEANRHAKDNEDVMREARKATVELQNGRRGYRALWKHFLDVSVADLKKNYKALGVTFDLWLGESDAHETAVQLIEVLRERGLAYESEGAIVMDVSNKEDKKEVPPLILKTTDGALLYGTTDLATLEQRVKTYRPDTIIYVTDKRQALHFKQVFRAARRAEIAGEQVALEHIGFGTMNGTDNKPFKTREGGTLRLTELLTLVTDEARKRMKNMEKGDMTEQEKDNIARKVGIATLKFADLSNYYASDYVFDIAKFSSFEGYTGPYLLYSAVRAKAILNKAEEAGVQIGGLTAPEFEIERKVLLELLAFPRTLERTWHERSPSILADYAYNLADVFSTFYHECPVLKCSDESARASRLALVLAVKNTIVKSLELLGIEVPERM